MWLQNQQWRGKTLADWKTEPLRVSQYEDDTTGDPFAKDRLHGSRHGDQGEQARHDPEHAQSWGSGCLEAHGRWFVLSE